MKNLLLIAISILFLASCGSDDDCEVASFLGDYNAVGNCSDGTNITAEATITAGNGNTIDLDIDGDVSTIQVDGCNLIIPELTVEFFGINITTSGDGSLNGDVVTINQKIIAAGEETNCTITLTRR